MKKIAIVTGASSGMGVDFAGQIPFLFPVDEVWLLARRKERLAALKAELDVFFKNNGLSTVCRFFDIDLCGKSGVDSFCKILTDFESSEEKINIKVLVNNAGFGTYGTFEETEISREMEMVDLNCTSLTGICGVSLKYMQKGSIIINTASLASFLPLGNFAVYGATKSFVLSFTIALAAELKEKGISVCALCPGPVSTEFANVASNGARKAVRHGRPSEKVVAHCLKCIKKGKKVAIFSWKWKFQAFASRFVGKFFGAWVTYKYCKRPCNH